tara:strand:+ start:11278 stop:12198 length:921 start_codon:yes stop_codon:yes gene_type:complete
MEIDMIINQEADEIAYRVAFACQKQAYIIDTGKTQRDLGPALTKTRIVKALAEKGRILDKDYQLGGYTVVEDENIVKHTLRMQIDKLTGLEHPELGKCSKLRLFLSPSDGSNFRNHIVTIPGPKGLGYKAKRPPKPHHLKFIRAYMRHHYDAVETKGYEADDALSMYQTDTSVASHIDKDISMVPGWHYDWVMREFYYVEKGLGRLELTDKNRLKRGGLIFFYAQMLMGDSTDNIPGIKRLGPVKAYKLLNAVETEQQAFDIVVEQYRNQYEDNWQVAIEEVADLLWMVRKDKLTGRQYLKEQGLI